VTDNPKKNLSDFIEKVNETRNQKVDILLTPEVTNLITSDHKFRLKNIYDENDDPFINYAKNFAKINKLIFIIGSLVIKDKTSSKCYNRQIVISETGQIIATYNKIHMFDVSLGNNETYRESKFYNAGDTAVVVNTTKAKIGLSICYDLRFPKLYQDLAKSGAEIILVPSAFTQKTGELHWESLLRARAIETGCFVLAAGQCGQHNNEGRRSYGHSMIISPWGKILTKLKNKPDVCYSEINLKIVYEYRSQIPSLDNQRNYKLVTK